MTSAISPIAPDHEKDAEVSLRKSEIEAQNETTSKLADLSINSASDLAQKTVFHDNINFNVKHPLQSAWTLWYTKPPTEAPGSDWRELLKVVFTFSTVEEFWGLYNNIGTASKLVPKSDFHLFREGVRPEWEDKQNMDGGRWSYQVKAWRGNAESSQLDDMWLQLMLGAIGEMISPEGTNEVMGVVCNMRLKFCRISIWTRSSDASHKETLTQIGQNFRTLLNVPKTEKVDFSSHDESKAGSTRAKVKFSI